MLKDFVIYANYYKLISRSNLISKVFTKKEEILPNQMGYETNVFLHESLGLQLYGADATGSDKKKIKSINIAISEAIERSVFLYHLRKKTKLFGFDYNMSTIGMAVFPKIFSTSARQKSYYEAVERWAIIEWWNERLGIAYIEKKKDFCIFEIKVPFGDVTVVVVQQRLEKENQYVYGFGAGYVLEAAKKSALKELMRNRRTVISWVNHRSKGCSTLVNIYEKRLMFFADIGGAELFKEIVNMTLNKEKKNYLPELVFSGEVEHKIDPSIFCWRTIFKQSEEFDINDEKVFLF